MPTAPQPTPAQMSPEETVRRVGHAREVLLSEVHKVIIERLVSNVPEPAYGEKGAPPSLLVVTDVPQGSSLQPPDGARSPVAVIPTATKAAQLDSWPPGVSRSRK